MLEFLYSLMLRPYVALFLVAFLVMSWLEQGILRTGIWLVTGYLVAFAAEWGSIRHGVPFGYYAYHYDALKDDTVIAGVPFFDSLSFVFLSYVSFSFAQFFLSPHWRRGFDIQRVTPRTLRNSSTVLVTGAFLMMVLDWIIDPVAHLGRHWFLGDIYHYPEPGWHFGVTLANYAGWFAVGWIIIFINQQADRLLAKRELSKGRPLTLQYVPGKGLFAPLFWLGIATFTLTVTAWLGWGYDLKQVPADGHEAFIAETRKLFLASTFIIAPIAMLAWIHLIRDGARPSPAQLMIWQQDYPDSRLNPKTGADHLPASGNPKRD